MKANIIFFDTISESANGTLRGLIAFITVLLSYFFLHKIDKDLFYLDDKTVVMAIIMASMLGVIEPSDIKSVLLLGTLTGIVIFTLIYNYNSVNKTYQNTFLYLLAGSLIGLISNFIVWKLYWTTNLRIKGSTLFYLAWQLANFLFFIYLFNLAQS